MQDLLWLLAALTVGWLAVVAEAGEVIRLYPGPAPGTESWTHDEQTYHSDIFQTQVVTNVSTPTLEAFLPEQGSGAAVIIAPGGGFHALSINSEGNDVARWLNARGVAAFVLRYRLVPGGDDVVAELVRKTPDQAQQDMAAVAPLAGADGLAAMRLVRARADDFGLDADRIGFMGFSAGGTVAMFVATRYDEDTRPAFLAPVYAAARGLPDWTVPDDAPPMFLVAASDDPLGLAPESVRIYERWQSAGRPVELHLYAEGGHGFGMRTQNLPSDTWIERFGDWLEAGAYLSPR